MRLKKPMDQQIQETAKSYADSLGVDVSVLKETKISLADIVAIRHDTEVEKIFSSAKSVWNAACFYMIKLLLKRLGKLPPEKDEE